MSLIDAPPTYEAGSGSGSGSGRQVRRSKSDRGHGGHRRKTNNNKFRPDTIDKLDASSLGGPYHHGGPYDAALRSYNLHSKYAPLAATKEGNRAAWEATPREAQMDALLRGRPLDGVGVVPPGHRAMNGEVMRYEEGADLMRDMSPGGGAYKRWPGVQYHPDDLKGKGEPGFTIDNERKARKAAGLGRSASTRERRGEYEMLPRQDKNSLQTPVMVRQRSVSDAAAGSSSRPKEVVEGLKRRLGSLRRK